ncbi:hypothetical protein KIPB_006460, partial [Kipferlia bialata]|eukprot:g6460.t1
MPTLGLGTDVQGEGVDVGPRVGAEFSLAQPPCVTTNTTVTYRPHRPFIPPPSVRGGVDIGQSHFGYGISSGGCIELCTVWQGQKVPYCKARTALLYRRDHSPSPSPTYELTHWGDAATTAWHKLHSKGTPDPKVYSLVTGEELVSLMCRAGYRGHRTLLQCGLSLGRVLGDLFSVLGRLVSAKLERQGLYTLADVHWTVAVPSCATSPASPHLSSLIEYAAVQGNMVPDMEESKVRVEPAERCLLRGAVQGLADCELGVGHVVTLVDLGSYAVSVWTVEITSTSPEGLKQETLLSSVQPYTHTPSGKDGLSALDRAYLTCVLRALSKAGGEGGDVDGMMASLASRPGIRAKLLLKWHSSIHSLEEEADETLTVEVAPRLLSLLGVENEIEEVTLLVRDVLSPLLDSVFKCVDSHLLSLGVGSHGMVLSGGMARCAHVTQALEDRYAAQTDACVVVPAEAWGLCMVGAVSMGGVGGMQRCTSQTALSSVPLTPYSNPFATPGTMREVAEDADLDIGPFNGRPLSPAIEVEETEESRRLVARTREGEPQRSFEALLSLVQSTVKRAM